MARKKFWRKDTLKILKLGRKKKKLRKWRKAKGKRAKIRKKQRGYLSPVEIGYKKQVKGKAKLKPKIICNVEELRKITDKKIVLIGKIGKKKKIEIAKAALESNIKILNLNAKAFLQKIEEEKRKAEEKKLEEKKKEKAEEKAKKEAKKEKVEEEKPEEKKTEEKKIEEKVEKEKMLKQQSEALKQKEMTKIKTSRQEIKRKALEK